MAASKTAVESTATSEQRAVTDGKFFRIGTRKFHPRGVAYGPFAPDSAGLHFATPEQTLRDFAQIVDLGANLLRVYTVPPLWLLDLALAHGLRLLVDVPWNQRACFLETEAARAAVRAQIREAARACGRHPAVFALSVANELPPDMVRWSGTGAVEAFLDDLVTEAKSVAPDLLCTFGNFPPTEFLQPRAVDFHCFNVYLHQPAALRNYLARLQLLADGKPLVLGECGMDVLREGAERQAALAGWSVEAAFRGGLAGAIVFRFTDEWYKDGRLVEDWQFGLTTAARERRPAFAAVQSAFRAAPYFTPARQPFVSVVVAGYNAAATLPACLESLQALNYPHYEVILVDDGSTDDTPALAAKFPAVRFIRHPQNEGLSAARNTGIAAAQGEVIAFTDADCRADADWLHYLVGDLVSGGFAGIGGHNLLPPDDASVAAAVMVSPGGPVHVMLTDRVAEHIPGCNMAFWKTALVEAGGFDPQFRRAGDDVDLCWRLQQVGHELGFSPAGFVWHYRRSTVRAYLRQQQGYGEAEAMLARKHPEYFSPLGGSVWRGRIYASAEAGLVTRRPMIYHGRFGRGMFQSLYTAAPSFALMALTSLEYWVLVTLPLLALGSVFHWVLPIALASALGSVGVCVAAAAQADLPRGRRRAWSRPLIALLFALQPIVRGWARYRGRLLQPRTPLAAHENLDSLSRQQAGEAPCEVTYQDEQGIGRDGFLQGTTQTLERHGWQFRVDSGWNEFDLEIYGSRWSKLELTTVTEHTDAGQQLVRCRLRERWTLPARLAFFGTLGATVVGAGLLQEASRWYWLLLALPALLAWGFRRSQRSLRRVFAVFLNTVAKDLGLLADVEALGARRRGSRLAEPSPQGNPPAPPDSALAAG